MHSHHQPLQLLQSRAAVPSQLSAEPFLGCRITCTDITKAVVHKCQGVAAHLGHVYIAGLPVAFDSLLEVHADPAYKLLLDHLHFNHSIPVMALYGTSAVGPHTPAETPEITGLGGGDCQVERKQW